MKTYQVSQELFLKHKELLNEKCFWRENPQGIEIKFVPAYIKYIPKSIFNQLTKNPI